MRTNRIVSLLSTTLLLCASITFSTAFAESLPTEQECKKLENKSAEISGWCAAVDRFVGNCLACHIMITPKWPEGFPEGGNTAPPLVGMKQRFPDRDKLVAQISDSREANEHSLMPPFAAHGILNQEQINNIVDFLYTL